MKYKYYTFYVVIDSYWRECTETKKLERYSHSGGWHETVRLQSIVELPVTVSVTEISYEEFLIRTIS